MRFISSLRLPVAAFAAASLIACTHLQVRENPSPAALHASLDVGRDVAVLLRSGKRYALRVTAVDDASFTGRDADDKAWKVPFAQVQQIEQREFSGGRTTALVLGSVVATLGALWLIGVHAIENDMDDAFGSQN